MTQEFNETNKDMLVSWLNDAYSMEQALIPVLENHAKDFRDYPDTQRRISQHVEETRRHAELVKRCVEHLGESVSSVKSGFGTLLGQMKSVSTGMFDDELIKNCLSDYAAEHFEIACYKSLIDAAELYGDQEIAQTCQQILHDEEEMARFLDTCIGTVTREVIRLKVRKAA